MDVPQSKLKYQLDSELFSYLWTSPSPFMDVPQSKLLLKYAKKHSLKTLDAMQLSVMKAINHTELKAVVCADEKFCKVITLDGFSVINPIKDVSL